MGSDQIWNPQITKGFHKPYFGYFDFSKENRKYIAYAASMEASSLTQEEKAFYKKALDNFNAISVRETTLADLLQPLTSKKIETVLDPTLLANTDIWNSIVKRPLLNCKYVLVYQVRFDKNTRRIAQDIANQIGAKVIEITAWINWKFKKNVYQCCSPEEFLGWIKYASCIVTTSFHGTAFSVIFNKDYANGSATINLTDKNRAMMCDESEIVYMANLNQYNADSMTDEFIDYVATILNIYQDGYSTDTLMNELSGNVRVAVNGLLENADNTNFQYERDFNLSKGKVHRNLSVTRSNQYVTITLTYTCR